MDAVLVQKTSFVIFIAMVMVVNCRIPDYIDVCARDHQNLSACIIRSIDKLRPRLAEGIVELGIPAMRDFHLGDITIDRIGNGSRLATNFTDMVVHGSENFQILKLVPTIRKRGYTFRIEANLPKLNVEGRYELDSQILFLDLVGKGPLKVNMNDYHFECILKGNKVKRGEHNYLLFEKMKCNRVIGKMTVLFENLFNGNQVYGSAVNGIINDNIDMFYGEFLPGLSEGLANKFTEIANKITLSFTYEELFPLTDSE